MNSYALCYDAFAAFSMSEQLAAFVKENRHITQWSQPFHGLYLLKSDAALVTLSGSFQTFFGQKVPHFLTVTGPALSGGILPQEIWAWLNAQVPPTGGLAPAGLLNALLAGAAQKP